MLHRLAELDGEVRAGYAAYDFQGVFQKLFTLLRPSDLSAFYFDVRKDALYCDPAGSLRAPRRRARCWTCCSTGWSTWLAPILVFTMEEVWLSPLPGRRLLGPPVRTCRRRLRTGATPRWRQKWERHPRRRAAW